jgi:hypothetical protein
MRTISTETDMDYLSLLASTGQPSFKDIKHTHNVTVENVDQDSNKA